MTAEYQAHGAVAVITLTNPPVNGMNFQTRTAAVECINRALDDASIKAIVITGAGNAFSGGADIKEFNSPKALAEPSLHTLIDVVENSSKPVVAAIHHVCMGGGLELSLGCHYRVATPGTQIALPEVKLGLLPGAGGTQRLPRVVGLELALKMITSGAPELSEKLANTALFDEILTGDCVAGAIAFAEKIADLRPLPKVRNLNVTHPQLQEVLNAARAQAQRGFLKAPLHCVEAIAAAANLPFDEGIQFERQTFYKLVVSPESTALRHAFFAERAASKIPDVPADTPIRSIKSAAVVGAGTMGGGIAMNFANAGIPVVILETKPEALEKGLAIIAKNYQNTRDKGKLSPEKCAERIALISGTLDYNAIGQADIVVEAVFEEMNVKKSVFEKLDEVMRQGAILASNTSTLDLNKIASFTKRPQDVVGMHFFSPANVMKLLEIVRGKETSNEVLASAMALSKKLKKVGVVSGVCDGFIGNRMLEQYIRQAGFLLDEGCLPAQVDSAMEKMGFAMGPFRMSDLAGNDISYAIRKRRAIEKPDMLYSKTADQLCELGRFGQKTGAGWYDYQAGDRTAHPSDLVNQLINDHSKQIGIERRAITDQEITERLIYALVNEAAYILEEGIAHRASDIDMVYLSGYGFPLHLGGPMLYADTVGLAKVVAAIQHYAQGHCGKVWKVAPLLQELAAKEQKFNA
ncbi:3-hydroxyacyl-CoA dehydrogenase NAD-binding domain-containing protein [Solimicrobium silvestre]|uniref:3-hydroxyacyl-CoA dehydrogenase, NAD binding domain n=1 Tax=Solimicrobium silvestre TaxID=2099400 RepID=A0A2S9GUQ2_9BURK|nr:3-hydroxyacyl-CoA dehydrogenase NAD-binding domain-containing protein [Solimicrobium silvestre]PRC91462.1 3-hydroxyacyl-CoA dehydrogenase, NAD binding domain [Solimicrobium silvestre]